MWLGAELAQVIANVARFSKMRKGGHHPRPESGDRVLAMKRNIADLPAVLRLGLELGAKQFSVSNVLPVTPELQDELLYAGQEQPELINSAAVPSLNLPKMDFDDVTLVALFEAFQSGYSISYAGHNWAGASNVCNYIEGGSMSVAWTGELSPAPAPDAYSHQLSARQAAGEPPPCRRQRARTQPARPSRLDPEYVAYRRIQDFAFAPCTFCGGCEWPRRTRRIVSATPSLSAAAACGRKA